MAKKPRKHYDIIEYEPWMADQVADLNVAQYGGTRRDWRAQLGRITDDPFCKDRSVAICAVDGELVVGVQTYRYWPYERDGQRLYALQSGGTLVHGEHRGQGLFMRMLQAGNAIIAARGVDVLTGFPVAMSFGGFMKDDWSHVDSPMWFLRVLRPLGLAKERLTGKCREGEPKSSDLDWTEDSRLRRPGASSRTTLVSDPEFLRYRYGEGRVRDYVVKKYDHDGDAVVFIGRRREDHGFSEFIIGDLLTTRDDQRLLLHAFEELLGELRRSGSYSACSVLVGTGMLSLYPALARHGFVPIFRKAFYIAKPLTDGAARWADSRWQWNLMFADMDTW